MKLGRLFLLFLAAPLAAAPAVQWQDGPGYRSKRIALPNEGRTGFTLVGPEISGILFTNFLPEQRHLTNQILLNGSGVTAGDVDGDGWTDLYFCALDGPNALYRNLGNWQFEEVGSAAGVECADLSATGAVLADLDGDGDLDLVVNSVGQGTHIFHNDGKGRFTRRAVFNEGRGGMSLALGDLDGDGFLDLYAANYRTLGLMDIPNARATFKTIDGKSYVETFNGRPTTSAELTNRFTVGPSGGIEENGEADFIARNVGGTNFISLPMSSFRDEMGNPLQSNLFDWGLAVAIRDVNEDGRPDIYVCNDFQTEDRFWIQQKDGVFQLLPRLAQRKSSMFSMAVDFGDINRDGYQDFFVADMLSRDHVQRMRDMGDAPVAYNIGETDNRPQYSLNTLFLNRGDATFEEIGRLSGVEASDWTWSCVFMDVDLDGWEDILISNGMERAARDLDVAAKMKALRARRRMSDAEVFQARKEFPRLATANVAFRNRRDLTFEDASAEWNFNLAGVSHGMALADLDNDGDLDVAINNLNVAAAIYRNDSTVQRIAVRLAGSAPNTRGIGAKISVQMADLPVQKQEMMAGGRYLSSDDPMRSFAAGKTEAITIEVEWRSGKRTLLEGLKPNQIYEIAERDAQPAAPEEMERMAPLFTDVSHLIHFTHVEEPFDDFARQPLLPRKLSQRGPVVTWADWDGDGWEDLILGGSRGRHIAVHKNDGKGSFQPLSNRVFDLPLKRDVTGLIAIREGETMALLAALSNYEDALGYGPAVQAYRREVTAPIDLGAAWDSAAGAVCVGDIDKDDDLDLFVGGAVVPGRYPAAASSRLFQNENGKFTSVEAAFLRELGLVNSAQFADMDTDGDEDLLVACEWGSIRLFLNNGGGFEEATVKAGLREYRGLWQGLAVADFDSDGKPDFVASNWGRNTKYGTPGKHQIRMYYGDFDDDGMFDLIEARFDQKLEKYVPFRRLDAVGGAIEFVNARFRAHAAYSRASVEEILGERGASAAKVEANWLESTVFMNRGGRFEARALPVQAQFSPAFGVCAADFDGDSKIDVVLAQNFFATHPETPRYDAGRGLFLKGDGKGGFEVIAGDRSGLIAYGEQRGVAAADYDRDGRLDLVITQNGGPVKLFRNQAGTPTAARK